MTEQPPVLGGRYALEEVIGRGGMAEVWRARDTRLGRDVAVKRLRVDLATDPTFQARFRREAQAAASLNHPNIVATYDTGEEADPHSGVAVPWIVMELVEGHTLRDLLRDDRRIRPERALEFSQGVLDALAYSHKAGIIHRDIKPANVMITPAGRVKVMDFGIARAVADTSATMTQTAAVIGTAQYLSPEQARGETVDNRSDIYSAGCLLYELLTGRPPFTGDSPVSVAYQHVREMPVPPSTLDPSLSPEVDAVVMKSLAKAPGDRYDDAKQMSNDIGRLLDGNPVEAEAWSAPTELIQTVGAPTAVTQVVGAATPASATSPDPVATTATATMEPVEEEERRRSPWAWVIGILLVLLLAVGGWFAWTLLKPNPAKDKVAVPSVVTMQEKAATDSLQRAGFTVKVDHTAGPDDKTVGTVVKSDPTGNTMAPRGSAVTITINDGPTKARIPKGLIGQDSDDATKELVAAGFLEKNITVTEASAEQEAKRPDAKAGEVVETDPVEGAEVVPGTQKITLYVAVGRVKIPDGLVGQNEWKAREALVGAGIRNDDIAVKDATADQEAKFPKAKAGEIILVEPESGSSVVIGKDAVTLVRATGKSSIPNLVGLDLATAKKTAESAGFVLEEGTTVEDATKVGKVSSQDQAPGQKANRGTTITVHLGTAPSATPTSAASSGTPDPGSTPPGAPAMVTMPDLTGVKIDKALQMLTDLGHTGEVFPIVEPTTNKKMDGKVIGQEPTTGTRLAADEPITLKVGKAG